MGIRSSEPLTEMLATVVEQSLERRPPTRAQALAILSSSDEEILEVVAAASKVRRRFFDNRVKLNFLLNVKSGLCPEDCFYCSQRRGSDADILRYRWLSADDLLETAERAVAHGTKRLCLVASGRGPSERDLERVTDTVRAIKQRYEDIEICVSLGLLSEGQPEQLVAAGVYAYNHNLNTSESNYADICTTHGFSDRVETVERAKLGGLSPCSGLLVGMGERDDELVDVLFSLRALDPDSVPVNFLMPFAGTPLANTWELTPQRCLRVLALCRFFFPDVEVRIAGGRELHLRSLQPLALHLANSMFLGDYLTSEGQEASADFEMIADAGFVIEGREDQTLPALRRQTVELRRRGLGTELPANS